MAVCLVFSLAACGGGGGGSDDPAGGGNGGGGSPVVNNAPLTFTALTANSSISTTNMYGTIAKTPSLEYSYDGENWEHFTLNTGDDATNTTVPLANVGDKVYLRATETNDYFSENINCICFKMTGSIAASGNVMSLLDKTCTSKVISSNHCFEYLFSHCSALKTAPELPATTLSAHCYDGMFLGCTGLTTAPELPAANLADWCYYQMFYGCSALITVPSSLPAATLAEGCYDNMFLYCTGLTTAPELPATTLAENCYAYMFSGCSSLTTVPSSLPAATLAEDCYYAMFDGCSSLTTAPDLPATTLANDCYAYMFYGCSSLTTAPTLPATTLVEDCYCDMFKGCSNLENITVHFTDWNDVEYATLNWVDGVAATGNFYCLKPDEVDGLEVIFDDHHIPAGWTVRDLSTP